MTRADILRRSTILISIILLAGTVALTRAVGPTPGADARASLESRIDALLSPVYKAGEPGAALLVAKEGKPVVRKAYGMADLELGAVLEPDMVFRIGSMTKQFTAVAILMLMEQGKLALSDPVTKLLSDFPTLGRAITVEHLLTHTSGIKSYTDLAEWRPLRRNDMTVAELIALFKDKPLDFEPGERWLYNNSGYILLGAIIEKVSGQSYEAFMQEQVFDRLGLAHTHYGSAARVIPRRIPGYEAGPNASFRNAAYLSMTQPYAAGSLLSNVDDLAAWNQALLDGRLIRRETLEKAWKAFVLEDGTSSGYGYGWGISQYMGHRRVSHGGGINGFASDGVLFPDDRLFVVLLTNSSISARAPGRFVPRVAAMALGQPYADPKAATVPADVLAPLAGVYANRWKQEFSVRVDGTRVQVSGPGIPPTTVLPLSTDAFYFPGSPSRVEFKRDALGRPNEVLVRPDQGPELRFARTGRPLPPARKPMMIDPGTFDHYAGEYEIRPGFSIRFFRQGDAFMTQATGQQAYEIFAESETRFFLKVVDAQVEFVRDASGAVTGIILTQNGRSVPGKRIEK